MMRRTALLFLTMLTVCVSLFAENKTALVIGNGAYKHFQPLTRPRSEAIDMKNALESIGFDVTLVLDGTYDQMYDAVAGFEGKLRVRGGIGFFHYGGHGVQVGGENFLLPVDKYIPDEMRIRSRAVNASEIIASMKAAGTRSNIIVLDACRDNPLPASSRSTHNRGLAQLDAPINSIVVYSAEAGKTAEDGIFTPVLIEYLKIPGLDINEVMIKVRRAVYERTKGRQVPGEYSQLIEPVYLAGTAPDDSLRSGTYEQRGYAASGGTMVLVGSYYKDYARTEGIYDTIACYWRDNKIFNLPVPETCESSFAASVYIRNGVIYVAGAYRKGRGNSLVSTPCYWLNGRRVDLDFPSGGKNRGWTNDLFVENGNVHIVGAYHQGVYRTTPVYWRNGKMKELPVPGTSKRSIPTGLYVEKGDVYISGHHGEDWLSNVACYWMNGNRQDLSISSSVDYHSANDICVEKNLIYISGTYSTKDHTRGAVYWLNGRAQKLAIPDEGRYVSTGPILISDGSLYIGGSYKTSEENNSIACYWKNGELVSLFGKDAYVASIYIEN